jgi:hypothetical protein
MQFNDWLKAKRLRIVRDEAVAFAPMMDPEQVIAHQLLLRAELYEGDEGRVSVVAGATWDRFLIAMGNDKRNALNVARILLGTVEVAEAVGMLGMRDEGAWLLTDKGEHRDDGDLHDGDRVAKLEVRT